MTQIRHWLALLTVLISVGCTTYPNNPTNYLPSATPLPTLIEPDALATRQATILNQAPVFETPENWNSVPTSCAKSMVRVSTYMQENNTAYYGSSTLIHTQQVKNSVGEVFTIYRLLTANHNLVTKTGQLIGSRVGLTPGNYLGSETPYDFINYYQITNDRGYPIDVGIVTVYGSTSLPSSNLETMNLNNIVRGTKELVKGNGPFYSFDYPGITDRPQFTISTVIDTTVLYEDRTLAVLMPNEGSSTVIEGSSGAAICNKDGQIVGIAISLNHHWPNKFEVEKLPKNIQRQIINIIVNSDQHLRELGFSF